MQVCHPLKAVFIIALCMLSPVSHAETVTVKRTLAACASEALSGELHGYEAAKDQKGVSKLIASGQCIAISAGESVAIVRPGILTATIEYQGRKLFTRADALR